jgi:hypothetical protein
MKIHVVSLLLLLSTTSFTQQQPPQQQEQVRQAQIDAMKKFEGLAGKWSGSGTFSTPAGPKEFKQTEEVDQKLDGLLITIEGLGTLADDKKIHHAFATISFEPNTKQYKFRSFTAEGRGLETTIEPADGGGFAWGIQQAKIRYTARVKDGEWHEIGEREVEGKGWVKFIEFRLKR